MSALSAFFLGVGCSSLVWAFLFMRMSKRFGRLAGQFERLRQEVIR